MSDQSNTNTATGDKRKIDDNSKEFIKVPFQVHIGNSFTHVSQAAALAFQTYDGAGGAPDPNRATSAGSLDNGGNTIANIDDTMIYSHYFEDTTCGGNDAANCVWQFNRDDDIVHPMLSTLRGTPESGMGRVYASTTQRDQQIAWFTFGTPKFTGLGNFYSTAYMKDVAVANESGFIDAASNTLSLNSIMYNAGKIGALAFALPLIPIIWFNNFAKRLSDFPCNRYYDLRATMHLYYLTVDSMLGEWLVNTDIYANGTYSAENAAATATTNTSDLGEQQIQPDTGSENLGPAANNAKPASAEEMNNGNFGSKWTPTLDSLPLSLQLTGASIFDIVTRKLKIMADAKNTVGGKFRDIAGNNEYAGAGFGDTVKKLMTLTEEEYDAETGKADGWSTTSTDWGSFSAAALGGLQFVGFRVEKDVAADESFSNSTSPSAMAEQINSKIRDAASTVFDSGIKAVGGEDGVINSVIQGVSDAVDWVSNNVFTQFKAVSTGATIDIPERYSGSDFSKSHSLKFNLRSPNGDIVSIYQSIMVPLCMLLSASMPRAAGASSYLSPFLCRVYCKGMFSIPMGIIESISISRGASEFGWNYQNLPTSVDVSLSIKDLSPAMYITVKDAGLTDILGANSNYNEYMLTLAGVGLWERISRFRQIQRNTQFALHKYRNKYLNPNAWVSRISETSVVSLIASFTPDTTIRGN